MSKIRKKLVAAASRALGAAQHRLDAASRVVGAAGSGLDKRSQLVSDFCYGAYGGMDDPPWRRES